MDASKDDERHRREEAERRAKRKALKERSRSDAQREKERKRKEHVAGMLAKHGGSSGHKRSKTSGRKPPPPPPPGSSTSKFQSLFSQRAQGFQIDFSFRNAPPRPPVGPVFVGHSLDGMLIELSRQYKTLNSVEVNYTWKLHSEADLGVPLAPSAMDPKSYEKPKEMELKNTITHPDDEALLNWKGSLGDSAAEARKKRQEYARAMMRASNGKVPMPPPSSVPTAVSGKKPFSRLLDETMQSWMKKTTYLSNDYSRKVHDFRSLAQTKQKVEQELESEKIKFSQRRSAKAIEKSFESQAVYTHPTKKNLKPKVIMPLLPNVDHWGRSYTHVVIDKAPNLDRSVHNIDVALISEVEKRESSNKMVCQMWVPSQKRKEDEAADNISNYQPVQGFELDVQPLKEEDEPHANFCLWMDSENKVCTFLPLSSRVQLSGGRPLVRYALRKVSRREATDEDLKEVLEQRAEVDVDVAENHKGHSDSFVRQNKRRAPSSDSEDMRPKKAAKDDDDDDDNDDDDDDNSEEETFGGLAQTIVAEG